MRAFISLEVTKEIKQDLEKIQKDLKSAGIEARWVKPEINHLTLVFLGSISPDKATIINNILEEISHQIKPVKLKLHQLGCFPSPQKPRVIFVALQGELGKLNALALKIRKGLKKEKIWFDEKPFSAHITLGRVRKRESLAKIIHQIKIKKMEFIADEITLQKSTLTDTGPVYETLQKTKLG